MKWLLLGNSNVFNFSKIFLTTEPSVQKDRRVVKCTTFTNFKLQVQNFSTFRFNSPQYMFQTTTHFVKGSVTQNALLEASASLANSRVSDPLLPSEYFINV